SEDSDATSAHRLDRAPVRHALGDDIIGAECARSYPRRPTRHPGGTRIERQDRVSAPAAADRSAVGRRARRRAAAPRGRRQAARLPPLLPPPSHRPAPPPPRRPPPPPP